MTALSKTVLVTGAKGFLGRYVARHYAAAGWRVVGVGHEPRASSGVGPAFGHGQADPRQLEWHCCDISLDALEGLRPRPDLVVHCAGSGSVAASMQDPFGDHARTVGSLAGVLEYVRRHCPEAVVIYPSSAAVYGNGARDPASEQAVEQQAAASPYGAHKRMAEQLCYSYAEHFGMRVAVVRFFSIYGEGLRKQLLWDACWKIRRGDDVYYGTGEESRDWLHAEDAARLVAAVAQRAGAGCPIYNGASGKPATVRQALSLLYGALAPGRSPRFSQQPRRGDPADLRADIGRSLSLGWSPAVPMAAGIARYARWFAGAVHD
ncbi:NAD(P)-dependent oxidoreductase [Cupriavidus sp. AU9028]|uniref:NAD-dependent epimerase/dehydratase family protein n=1 Tax=Cupriavidus sp. AU9028 TaxID=2871157 RepID=UPI001C95D2F9|nr:NAD-dependent epimerase/dehydratase family protein [Cupriavidus sp. AU9028]MBY4896849.1 NAD-dependent epimerase/dehydratase family protein [Cupriavidus sp. AU9028]